MLGVPTELVASTFPVLPTNLDVLRHFEWIRREIKGGKTNLSKEKDVAPRVAETVTEIWKRA